MELSVGREHVWITYPIESLARIHVEQGEFQAAVDLYRDGFATFERRYGNDPEGFSSMLDDYARALRGIGETEAADSVAAFEVPRAASD
jgi:hypothetical protein